MKENDTLKQRIETELREQGPMTFNLLINRLESDDGQMKLIIGDRIGQLAEQGLLTIDPDAAPEDPFALVSLTPTD